MTSTPVPDLTPVLEELVDEITFTGVLLESLDPHADDYERRRAELEDKIALLKRTRANLEHRMRPTSDASSLLPAQSSGHAQHQLGMVAAGGNQARSPSWWDATMNGRPSSSDSNDGALSPDPFADSLFETHNSSANRRKRERPPSSSHAAMHEHASKRQMPTPSYLDSSTSAGSFHAARHHAQEATRRRHIAAEAAAQRQREALMQDEALARRLSQQPNSASSSPRPSVQTTLDFNGGYHRPPPPVEPKPLSPSNPSRLPFYPSTPQLVKAESSSFPQPQQDSRGPLQPTGTIDLTGSDSDDVSEIAPERFPSSRRHGVQATQAAQIPRPWYEMAGAYPRVNPQNPQHSSSSGLGTGSFVPASVVARTGSYVHDGHQRGSNHTHDLATLIHGSSSAQPVSLDDGDDDDSDIEYQGARTRFGYGDYAGYRGLYQERYDALANYDPSKSKEEIEALLANIRPDEDMPAHLRVQTPEDMTVKLHKYQESGLTWLKQQEEGTSKGGILADDMGLGKTIQMLALMVTRKSEDPRCKTTLVVAPLALLRQWKQEIKDKLKPGRYALRVFTHHGSKKAKDFDDLRDYDVVLTTYGSIASEVKKLEKFTMRQLITPDARPTRAEKTVFLAPEARWYRVILDEAQCIKNRSTQTAKGALRLQAKYRFCVTGTPMMNNVEEFYSLIHFLRIKPYCQWERFRQDFKRPLGSMHEESRAQAMRKLQILCKSVMLRRTKKSTFEGQPILVLPDRSTRIDNPVFDNDERAFYKALESQTQLQFNKYLRQGTIGISYSAILVLLLRLRQACCHPHLIKDFGVQAAADMTEGQMVDFAKELSAQVIERIKATGGNFECPVCYDVTPNPAIFIPCGHDACAECFTRIADPANAIQRGEEGSHIRCPNCRGDVDPKRLTDFNSFKKVHMPELLTTEERAGVVSGDEVDADSETDSDDTSSESEDEDEGDDTLGGFIVRDSGGEEEPLEEEEEEDDPDTKPPKVHKEEMTSIKAEGMNSIKAEENDIGGPSNAIPLAAESSTVTGKAPKAKKSKGKGAIENGRADKKKKKKKKKKNKGKSTVTLAELKKLATQNKDAKRRYLRRLRKDWVSSAKIDKTLEIIKAIMDAEEGEKILIFSQWTSLLDLLEIPIHENRYGYRRYDGSMSAAMRGDAVDDFKDEHKNVRIMLISLKAGNAGLNLNIASQVIILDPFWNPYIEEQAIDRAHRIGQMRPVTVHRVLIKDTVEDRIIELQDKKRTLISEALDEAQAKNISRLGVQELAYLFGVTRDPSQNINYVPRGGPR